MRSFSICIKPNRCHCCMYVRVYAHEKSQAARFADPLRWCLANSAGDGGDGDGDDDPPTERLGLFTCVADTGFFLRAVGEASRFPLVTVVDLGDSLPRLGYEMGADTGLIFAGRDSEIVPETGLQVLLGMQDR